jgi:hypothetical protein
MTMAQGWIASDEAPLKLRREAMHAEPEESRHYDEEYENRAEMLRQGRSIPEARAVEMGISEELGERVASNEPEQREGRDAEWREPVRERQSRKDEQEFENEQAA